MSKRAFIVLCCFVGVLLCVASYTFVSPSSFSSVSDVYALAPAGYSLVGANPVPAGSSLWIDTSVDLSNLSIGSSAYNSYSVTSVSFSSYLYPNKTSSIVIGRNFIHSGGSDSYEPDDPVVVPFATEYFVSSVVLFFVGTDGAVWLMENGVWDVSALDDLTVSSDLTWTSTQYANNWLYYKAPGPSYASESVNIVYDESIQNVMFDGVTWQGSGASEVIDFDNENELYNLSVTPAVGYKAVSATVTYLSDGLQDVPAVYDFQDNSVNIPCPVGDAITSISIESELLSVGVLSYLQVWYPNVEDDYTGQIDYNGISDVYTLPRFSITSIDDPFLDYLDLWEYVFSLVNTSSALFNIRQYNIIGVSYRDGSSVSFPLTSSNYDSSRGGIVFLTRRLKATTTFSSPSTFAYFVLGDNMGMPNQLGGYYFTTPVVYSVAPYALAPSLDWYIVTRTGFYPTGAGVRDTTVHLYIDNQLVEYFTCSLDFNSQLNYVGINLSPVSSYLYDLSYNNGIVYYLDNVIYVTSESANIIDSSGNVTELYFSSGKSNWSPSALDAFSYLGSVFDHVFDILEIRITSDMTIGSILLIVLSLGVLMFLFRMGGIF